jgi:YVTN family beta-propeller protein
MRRTAGMMLREPLMRGIGLLGLMLTATLASPLSAQPHRLPTGVTLDPAAPTHRAGNFPLGMAIPPDGRRVALLLCGWREQGLQIIDRATGTVLQTIPQPAAFLGIAFAPNGHSLWTSGGNEDALYQYEWREGAARLDRRISLDRLQPEKDEKKDGKKNEKKGEKKDEKKKDGTLYPSGLAFSPDGRSLYVANNLGDSLFVVDPATGNVRQRLQTDRFPYAVVASRDGAVYVTSWGDDTVVAFRADATGDLHRDRRIRVGRHPSAILLDEPHSRLFVTLSASDRIVIVDTKKAAVVATVSDKPPGEVSEGSTPDALALSRDGRRLFVAEADNNAVAVIMLAETSHGIAPKLIGRIPTEWYPSAVAVAGDDLLVVSAKGEGTRPNPLRQQPDTKMPDTSTDSTLGQITGSLMTIPANLSNAELAVFTARVTAANHWDTRLQSASYPPFHHVIYIIKENRTYDQVLGDLPVGDGDATLMYFPRTVSPNHHALAERFGTFDRFFVNAEVSADGHNWSTAAYATDYLEKTTPSEYSSRGRTYDYEGTNRDVIVDEDDDVAAPAAGYLWDLALRKKISLRNYGEFVVAAKEVGLDPAQGEFRVTRRALAGHTNLLYPPFDLEIRDQRRIDVWLEDFQRFVASAEMPALQIIRLPNDHTSAGKADMPTPRAAFADNDLALGRLIEALSHSPFWKDTVVFVLEDDAQNGPDHVDSHRSPLFVISPWNRPGVVHRFANTTDVIATIEQILGLASMSQFDRFGRPLRDVFASTPDFHSYDALKPDVDLNEKNPKGTKEATESATLDLSRADAADEETFNRILWRMMKGNRSMLESVRPAGPLMP